MSDTTPPRPRPKQLSTALTTTTTTSASNSDHEDTLADPQDDEPWLFRLLNRAAAFGDVIAEHCAPAEKPEDARPDVVGLLGRDLASIAKESPPSRRASVWRAAAPELVKLGASSWLRCRGKSAGLAGSASDSDDESDVKVDDDLKGEEKAETETETEPRWIVQGISLTDEPEPIQSPLPDESVESPLTAQEKVALIISEFGALAEDGEEETLIIETDASFFQDVAILGVIHLTTHRLAFHASLLNTRPDLARGDAVLHAGPAIIIDRALRRRKRVWMELSHDMITTYRSSEERERVRPLRTVLLSAFRKIYPIDPLRPRVVRIEFAGAGMGMASKSQEQPSSWKPKRMSSWRPGHGRSASNPDKAPEPHDATAVFSNDIEFDTEEAALGWRREIQAALYMWRHRRRAVFESEGENDEDAGVRISVPLKRIRGHNLVVWANLATVIQLDLGAGTQHHPEVSSVGMLAKGWETPQGKVWETTLDTTHLQFGILQPDAVWTRLDALIQRARAPDGAGAVVDFGALTFVESGFVGAGGGEVPRGSREKEVRRVFGLGDDVDVWITKCSLNCTILTSGLLAMSSRFVCFWSRLVAASDVKLRFYTADVQAALPAHVRGRGFGLTLQVRNHTDTHLEFATRVARDTAAQRLTALVASPPRTALDLPRTDSDSPPSPSLSLSLTPTPASTPPLDSATALLSPLSRTVAHIRTRTFPPAILPYLAKPINVPTDIIPYGIAPRHFVCLTIGSRGDVQPYIALGKGLQRAGHRVTIVTHAEYKAWVEGWGIGHRTAGGDPGALMKLSVEHKMFSPQFFRESIAHFRTWIDQLLLEAWAECQDADVLIESPSAMAGVHVAEALNIPYFRAFTMPWSKTTQYPHPFISPPVENSTSFNTASYVLFDNVFWLGTSGQINRWRKKHLGLEATDMGHMAQAKIPFLYNFSPSVVPKPLDWGDQITISGYWFLDNPDLGWTPAPALLQFIAQARTDAKPLVYIGFGSITVPDARAMTRSIVKAVLKSDVRAILSKGWSSRMDKEGPDVELPPEIYAIDKAPHDWLFPQMDAVLHHGGAGTTGASLRAGITTLIKPWFGDQFFWASRVQKLGAGLKVASLRSTDLAEALKKATNDRKMKEKAAAVGERIRQEDGVPMAIKAIYTYLYRAGRDRTTLNN